VAGPHFLQCSAIRDTAICSYFGVEEGGGLVEKDDLGLHISAFARVTSFL
jgi:hypothetical protein